MAQTIPDRTTWFVSQTQVHHLFRRQMTNYLIVKFRTSDLLAFLNLGRLDWPLQSALACLRTHVAMTNRSEQINEFVESEIRFQRANSRMKIGTSRAAFFTTGTAIFPLVFALCNL